MVRSLIEADVVVGAGTIVVTIDINHVIGRIIVVFVAVDGQIPHAGDVVEGIVDRKVNDIES